VAHLSDTLAIEARIAVLLTVGVGIVVFIVDVVGQFVRLLISFLTLPEGFHSGSLIRYHIDVLVVVIIVVKRFVRLLISFLHTLTAFTAGH